MINEKRCVDCGVCGRVCPKSAITNADGTIVEKKPRDQWYKPAIDVGQCSACSMCVDICGFDCLEITYPQFKGDLNVHAKLVNPGKCVGCSMCENICPLHAIAMKKPQSKMVRSPAKSSGTTAVKSGMPEGIVNS